MRREMIVVPYDKNWKIDFEEIKKTLKPIFGDLAIDIQHFGSTAIVGMSAKPIIDVMIIVSNILAVDDLNQKMKDVGYVEKGENGISGRRYFHKYHEDGVNHTQHIHCYEKDNQNAVDELMFRDYLNINQEAFETYKKTKIEASEKFRFSPLEYTEYKTTCVNKIMKQAKIYYQLGM